MDVITPGHKQNAYLNWLQFLANPSISSTNLNAEGSIFMFQ
jgi:hypothetical protein